MSMPTKAETALMSRDENDVVALTHHPAILDAEAEALVEARTRLRALLDKERTLVRGLRRSIRGKAETRGGSFPGDVDKPARRKQVLAAALKRLSRELSRREALAAREATRDAARKALALKQAADGNQRPPSRTADEGMRAITSDRRRTRVPGAKIGSISQQTKNAQAARDNRG
jgi:hypothetical protein